MPTTRCDCCGTPADPCGLDVLRAAGWSLAEHAEGEHLVLLCPVCSWQRSRASEAVNTAVEAAYPAHPHGARDHPGTAVKGRGGWFWS